MTCKTLDRHCEELLLEYAAGTLDDAHMLVMATFLTLSPEGRRYVDDCERIGGAMMEHLCDPVDVSAACLEQLLEKIACADTGCGEKKTCCNETCIPCNDILPAPLAALLPPGKASVLHWKNRAGASHLDLPLECRASHATLMRCNPGHALSPSPDGFSITLVLEGSLRDRSESYSRGDLLVLMANQSGPPVADAESGCLCLCVTTGPVRQGFLARLYQRFFPET